MDAICLIAAPGAGTAEAGRVLAACPDVAVHSQVFVPPRVRGIEPEGWALLSRLTGVRFGRTDDPALAAFVREHPAAWLDAVEATGRDRGKRLMVFSLLSGDLPVETAGEAVLQRPGLRVIMVMRKQIEAYIASLIAAHPAEAGAAPVRPAVDVELFAAWLDEQERWHAHWQGWLKRRFLPCPVLRYETDIDQPAGSALRRIAAAAAQVGVTIRMPAKPPAATPARADRPPLGETVANWQELNRAIFARGLERRAFGYPV